jgi:hypothetical protein
LEDDISAISEPIFTIQKELSMQLNSSNNFAKLIALDELLSGGPQKSEASEYMREKCPKIFSVSPLRPSRRSRYLYFCFSSTYFVVDV